LQAELVAVAGVNSAHQRLDQVFVSRATQATRDEGAQALIGVAPARQDEVEGHARLAAPGEEGRGEQRRQPGRRHHLEPLGQRMEAPAVHDEGAAVAVVGAEQARLQVEPPAERQRPGLLGDERVRAALHDESIAPLGADVAAQTVGPLEQREVQRAALLARELHRAVRGGQPRNTSADYRKTHTG
jgi:hypothetical protein